MSVSTMNYDDLPSSDLPEIVYRLHTLKHELDEVGDDWSRTEIYDRIETVMDVINDVIHDLTAIEKCLKSLVDA